MSETRWISPKQVDDLRARLHKAGLSVSEVARELGLSRSHTSQIISGTLPMKRVHGLAIRYILLTHLHRKQVKATLAKTDPNEAEGEEEEEADAENT